MTVDGTTQPGYAGSPMIILDGSAAGSATVGLVLKGAGITVKALAIDHFGGDGIDVGGGSNDTIAADVIGLTVRGRPAPARSPPATPRRATAATASSSRMRPTSPSPAT